MSTATRPMTRQGSPAPDSRRGGGGLRMLVKAVCVFLAVVLAALLLLAGSVVASARAYGTERTDAIVVLGAAQYWSDPSPVFSNRLDHAIELYRQGVAPEIVTVGGGIPGDVTTEAQAGADYLRRQGIPDSDITVVAKGSDTIESIEAVGRKAKKRGWNSMTIVSDRAHVARSAAVAEGLGFETQTNGPASGDGSLLSFSRVGHESLGLARFYMWDRWLLDR